MICNTILDAMGDTPVIRLRNMVDEDSAEILVKFEGLNVGGSIKTRTALNMIKDAEERGIINSDSIIVEPTSGNPFRRFNRNSCSDGNRRRNYSCNSQQRNIR